MTPERLAIDAHATLADATRRWPLAHRNLIEMQGGMPGFVAAWPTGHSATSRLADTDQPPQPDPCRAALAQIDYCLGRIITTTEALLDWPARRYDNPSHRLYYALGLVLALSCVELHRSASPDCDTIRRHAYDVRDLIRQWGFTPAVRQAVAVGVESVDWCANHSRYGIHDEPVTDKADTPLCDFCWSYQRNDPRSRRPGELLLRRRREGRLTSRDVA